MDTDYEIIKLNDGGIYHGEVNKNGLPQSSDGTCTWVGKKMSYSGGWIDGKMAGIGTLYENGKVKYRGFWWEGELIHIFGNEELPKPEEKLPKNKNRIVALLIGNSYPGSECPLPKSIVDVDVIGDKLKRIGVEVKTLKNATEAEFLKGIKELCNKDTQFDHVLIYFSGHGETHHYNYVGRRDDNSVFTRVLGPFHTWISNDRILVYQEWDLLANLKDSNFKNVIIINDACQVTRLYNFDDLPNDNHKKLVLTAYTNQNNWQSRNLLTANAALEGWEATEWSNDKCGLYALGLIQYLEQKNLPVVKMFEYVNDFVVKYSMREKGEILQQPNTSFTMFDTSFCLYDPEE